MKTIYLLTVLSLLIGCLSVQAQEKEDALLIPVKLPYCSIFDTSARKMVDRTVKECLDYWVVMHFEYPEKALKWGVQGHVGVLFPDKDGYLFVEKLTFEEPYQAIKFATKEDVYKYLQTKYKDYTGEGLAKPFIMDNDKWVEGK